MNSFLPVKLRMAGRAAYMTWRALAGSVPLALAMRYAAGITCHAASLMLMPPGGLPIARYAALHALRSTVATASENGASDGSLPSVASSMYGEMTLIVMS